MEDIGRKGLVVGIKERMGVLGRDWDKDGKISSLERGNGRECEKWVE